MRYHLHTMKIHLIVQFNNLSKFRFVHHHYSPGLENSFSPENSPVLICNHSWFPHTQHQATINLFSYSIGCTFLGKKNIFQKWIQFSLKNILGKSQLNFMFLSLLTRIPNIWTFTRSSPAYIPRGKKVY